MIINKIKARKLGKVNGRAVYRFPVRVDLNDTLTRTFESKRLEFHVSAYTAKDASEFARQKIVAGFIQAKDYCPAEIAVTGVRGGIVENFIGWERAIWLMMEANETPGAQQLKLI